MKASLSCMYNHTAMCGKNMRDPRLSEMMKKMGEMHMRTEGMCSEVTSDGLRKMELAEGQEVTLSLGIVFGNPFLSKRDLCRYCAYIYAIVSNDQGYIVFVPMIVFLPVYLFVFLLSALTYNF